MTTRADKPTTRETYAMVRDRGRMRSVLITITGMGLELRLKGLRSRETVDAGWLYQHAVKTRVFSERAERAKARKKGR